MARRRFHALPEAFASDSVTLGRAETQHARDVLRLAPGDEIFVFDGKGNEYRCRLAAFGPGSSTAEIIEQVKFQTPSNFGLTLAVALLKGDKFDLIVQKATELGVQKVVPVITRRADVKIRNQDEAGRKVTRWQRIAQEAMKQCGRADSMEIANPIEFGRLMPAGEKGELRLLFAEREGVSFESACGSDDAPSQITAMVGSEGGWTDDEISEARQDGWQIVTLGGRTLRAETAAIVVATLLQHHFGDLK